MIDAIFTLSRHFLKIYNRPYVRSFLKTTTLNNRFSIIVGQRGVGKSTTLIQHLLKYSEGDLFSPAILYVQSDHFVTSQYTLYEIAEEFTKYGGELICFDEVHKYKNWSSDLKSIYDTFPNLKIVASGSSILEIHKGSHDLSRRAIVYHMHGMSFREFIELSLNIALPTITLCNIITGHIQISHDIIEKIEGKKRKILALFKDYLKFGYYPYFLEFTETSQFQITLEQQIHTTIESDLMSVYPALAGESIRKLKKLFSVISANVPFTPDMKKIMRIVDIGDGRTLKMYFKYLEDGGIIKQIRKAGREFDSLEKPEKIFLNNTNQLYALNANQNVNPGTVRETFFANIIGAENQLSIPQKGDFLVDGKFLFEVGGKNKSRKQIAGISNSYLALDDIEHGQNHKIPLWLFGFKY
jgi:predicted AAA+ superfamily ATPase